MIPFSIIFLIPLVNFELGEILGLDIHQWLPYQNDAYLVSMNGSVLKQMLEISGQGVTANEIKTNKDWGQFLQVSSKNLVLSTTQLKYQN